MKKLIAKGKDIHGDTREFNCLSGTLYCNNNQLTELKLPEGVEEVYCDRNQLTELNIPEGVEEVYCDRNQLTELILPKGVKKVSCVDNQITHLNIPDSVKILWCDKEVKGLERYVGKVKMKMF